MPKCKRCSLQIPGRHCRWGEWDVAEDPEPNDTARLRIRLDFVLNTCCRPPYCEPGRSGRRTGPLDHFEHGSPYSLSSSLCSRDLGSFSSKVSRSSRL